ncbi:hypothetical protein SDRG_02240 [Saprolegnia diclina VS20]|uniref:Uncharacterized protein n=1 Tax=Saprolegnia diclina (strain VS20) TaxID=1156394 RepID=T0QQC4_SAPDV|nr:hypothetical protein SDRG_02240 [Saprolegnia diclina VS20]EQC40339.1 hypothetical protein SDRG_02240 [Saprolegnia diclina VS20]|eukprot:XP_008606038.1 hypothetical protein SDRG_02240 [Saprolegnia diclina VS20]
MSQDLLELVLSVNAAHCSRAKHPTPYAPRIRVEGLDDELTWPLRDAQIAALALKYPGDPIFVPESAMIFVDNDMFKHALGQDDHEVIRGLHPWGVYNITFTGLSIDRIGCPSAFDSTEPTDDTFGVQVHVLPSDVLGGAVTLAYEDRSTTWESVSDHMLGFYTACSLAVAPITAGARSVLLYRVDHGAYYDSNDSDNCDDSDDSDDDDVNAASIYMAPMPRPTQALMHRAISKPLSHIALCVRIPHTGPMSFALLAGDAKATVDYLVSTTLLDVALLHGERPVFHPACETPTSVVAATTRASLFHALNWHTDYTPREGIMHICFWPKAHRVYLLGLEAALPLVQRLVDGDSTVDRLGATSVRAFMTATVDMVRLRLQKRCRLAIASSTWSTLGALLLDFGDVDLCMLFLQHTATDGLFWSVVNAVRDWFLALVTRCGWQPLLPHLQSLMDATSASRDVMFLCLVERLILNNRLCVRQRHLTELLKAVLQTVLQRCARQTSAQHAITFVRAALRIASCLAVEGSDVVVGSVLSERLPASVLAIVESFDTNTLARAVQLNEDLKRELPKVLWGLRDAGLQLPTQTYLQIATAYYCKKSDCHRCGLAALLLLTRDTLAFDSVFDAALRRDMDLEIWADVLVTPGMHLAASQATSLLAQVAAAVVDVTPIVEITETTCLHYAVSQIQGALSICHYLKDDQAVATVLERVFSMQAMHTAPITFVMDVLVPLHDTCVGLNRSTLAHALATRALSVVSAHLAAFGTRDHWTTSAWACDCCVCKLVVAFADSSEPPHAWRFVLGYCRHLRTLVETGTVFHRYPSHERDVCLKTTDDDDDRHFTLSNHTTELLEQMRDAKARLEQSLVASM